MRALKRKVLTSVIVLCAVLCVIGELLARVLGTVDFPLYVRSDDIGYFLKPSQSGSFLDRNHWYVNLAGFTNQAEFRPDHPYTILTGDSVVYGGNPVDYATRVGTLAQRYTGQNVWTAAVGGWSLDNELRYLKQRQAVVAHADKLVIQFDNGDLDGLVHWGGEMVHPTHTPLSAAYYVVRRYALPRIFHIHIASELPPIPSTVSTQTQGTWNDEFDDLMSYYHGRILFILYPDRPTSANPALWAAQTKTISAYIARHADRIDAVDVGRLAGWDKDKYLDGIHPNENGRDLLARVIANWISTGRSTQEVSAQPSPPSEH